jgi:hypothetical protein
MTQENHSQEKQAQHWLDKIPWQIAPIAVLLALMPFKPEPHLLEKITMLTTGSLSRPIDIFDLFMHGTPLLLIILKGIRKVLGLQT